MLLKIHPQNPSERKIRQVIELLHNGGVIIYPTDTVYAFACSIDQKKAFERICKLKGLAPEKARFSLIFQDLSQAARYTSQIDNRQFKALKSHLPGPFTFILPAGNGFPVYFKRKKKTIGIRMPDHAVSTAIVEGLETPLLTTSLKSDDTLLEYYTDPSEIYDDYKKLVDCVIDAGAGTFHPSTVVDLTVSGFEIVREGQGEFQI